jgi:hypothetical protein
LLDVVYGVERVGFDVKEVASVPRSRLGLVHFDFSFKRAIAAASTLIGTKK